jgi:hypothetical protein
LFSKDWKYKVTVSFLDSKPIDLSIDALK